MGRRLQILHVSSGLDPHTGGTATAAVSVALAARRADLAVTLAYPHDPETAPLLAPDLARLKAGGVRVIGMPFWAAGGRRAAAWAIAPALHRYLVDDAGKFDVVHTHSAWVASSLSAVHAARRARVPVVLMPHEALTRFDMARGGNAALRRAKRLLRAWYLKRVDRFVVSSDLEARDSGLDGDARCVAIPHPVIDETEPAPAPPPPRAVGAPLRIGFLGRFHPKKNLQLLAEALSAAPGVRLVIGGGGDDAYRAQVEAAIAAGGVAERVEWRGFVDAAAKPGFLQGVDAVAMPSQFECFGLVGAEALALHTPVILSPTVGLADMIADRDCGVIVPARADALAACFRRLGDEPATLARWRERARAVALEQFSFAAHGIRLRAVYEALVSASPGAGTR